MSEDSECFKLCNDNFTQFDPRRIYCKKGCKSDFEKQDCVSNTCEKLCVKKELGGDDKWGSNFIIIFFFLHSHTNTHLYVYLMSF